MVRAEGVVGVEGHIPLEETVTVVGVGLGEVGVEVEEGGEEVEEEEEGGAVEGVVEVGSQVTSISIHDM